MKSIRKSLCVSLLVCVMFLLVITPEPLEAGVVLEDVPAHVINGLNEYAERGYEAAVHAWLKGSAYESGSQMASRIAFFKNIEMLAGSYQSYTILFTLKTVSSNQVYIRMNYVRLPGFILFISTKMNNSWVLSNIKLSRIQEYGTGGLLL